MKTALSPVYLMALDLIDRFDDEFLQLASVLRHLKETDPESLKSLLAERRLGRRKAYYLIEIDKAFGDIAEAQAKRLCQIGWTRLKVIAASVTSKNREKLLRLAERHTVEDLKALMRGKQPIEGRRAVLLYFSPEQYKEFAKEIVKAGAIKSGDGFANKEDALIRAIRRKKSD